MTDDEQLATLARRLIALVQAGNGAAALALLERAGGIYDQGGAKSAHIS